MSKKLDYITIKNIVNSDSNGCIIVTDEKEFINQKIKTNQRNSRVNIRIRCKCSQIYTTTIDAFKNLNKKQCNKCTSIKMSDKFLKWDYKNLKSYIEKKSEYKLFDIKRLKIKSGYYVTFLYLVDEYGYKYKIRKSNFDRYIINKSHKFDFVNVDNPFSIQNINTWVINNNIPYKLISKNYISNGSKVSSDKLRLLCEKHGEFELSWNSMYSSNCICTKCRSYKNENTIMNYLDLKSVNYKYQYKIKGCKHINSLPFDFAIFEDKEKTKLKCLIEYDGEGHYKPIDWAGKGDEWAKNQFDLQKRRDGIKSKYCKSNDIKLIRIPYFYKNNIINILNEILNGEC